MADDTRKTPVAGGLRSDGELVQAVTDRFDFTATARVDDSDHDRWCDLLSTGSSGTRDDPSLPDTILFDLGDGGTATDGPVADADPDFGWG